MSYTASSTDKQTDFTKPVLVYCHTHGTISVPTSAKVQTKQTSTETGGTLNATTVPKNNTLCTSHPSHDRISMGYVILSPSYYILRHSSSYENNWNVIHEYLMSISPLISIHISTYYISLSNFWKPLLWSLTVVSTQASTVVLMHNNRWLT